MAIEMITLVSVLDPGGIVRECSQARRQNSFLARAGVTG